MAAKIIKAVTTILLALIAIFAGIHYVGGSENHCSDATVCGDGNGGNTILPPSPTAAAPSSSKAR